MFSALAALSLTLAAVDSSAPAALPLAADRLGAVMSAVLLAPGYEAAPARTGTSDRGRVAHAALVSTPAALGLKARLARWTPPRVMPTANVIPDEPRGTRVGVGVRIRF